MRRTVATIKQYDYESKEEFEKDIPNMKKKGYHVMSTNDFKHGEIYGSEDSKWKYGV